MSWEDDPPLCGKCDAEKLKNILAELAEVTKEIKKWRLASAMHKMVDQGDIEEEELKELREKGSSLEREIRKLEEKKIR